MVGSAASLSLGNQSQNGAYRFSFPRMEAAQMPPLTKALPKYRKHNPSGQAIVTLNGVDFYLGPHGTKASRLEYSRINAANSGPLAIKTVRQRMVERGNSRKYVNKSVGRIRSP
jgi:hypothetical protein